MGTVGPTMMSPDFPGTDRFLVRGRLGEGGTGVVYEAFDRKRGMRVAIKTLAGERISNVRAIKREFRALADVVHPNLVVLYDLFAESDEWFFTMELVEGENFIEYVRMRRGRSKERRVGKECRCR